MYGTGSYLVAALKPSTHLETRAGTPSPRRSQEAAKNRSSLRATARSLLCRALTAWPRPAGVAAAAIGPNGAPLFLSMPSPTGTTSSPSDTRSCARTRCLPIWPRAKQVGDVKRERDPVVIGPTLQRVAGIGVDEERDLTTPIANPVAPANRRAGLNDLYFRFYRMASARLSIRPARGILLTSQRFLADGLSFPAMRERYLDVFDQIRIDTAWRSNESRNYAPEWDEPARRCSRSINAPPGSGSVRHFYAGVAEGASASHAEVLYRDVDQARAAERTAALISSLDAAISSVSTDVGACCRARIPFQAYGAG